MNLLLQAAYPSGGSGGGGGGSSAGALIAGVLMLLFVVVIVAAVVSIWGIIFSKAGYSFWMALLMLVPVANLVWLLIFAFSKWPIQVEVERLRAQGNYATGGFPVGPAMGYAPPPNLPRTS